MSIKGKFKKSWKKFRKLPLFAQLPLGFLGLLASPLVIVFALLFLSARKIYHGVWMPFLFWFNKTPLMGGRANAGKRGRQSRIARGVGNTVVVLAIIAVIIVFALTNTFTLGTALPFWAAGLIFLGVAINFTALPFGSSGNTVKIQTYYDTLAELQNLNNEKSGVTQEVPHGMHGSTSQKLMLVGRYGHDVNGGFGSLSSFTDTVLDFVSVLFTPIAPIVSLSLFTVSRASALISVGGAPLTNQHRLSVYKQNLLDQINTYYDLCAIKTPDIYKVAAEIINDVFQIIGDDKHHYTHWMRFRCFCALERVILVLMKDPAFKLEDLKSNEVKEALLSFINQFTEGVPLTLAQKIGFKAPPAQPIKQFYREKLRDCLLTEVGGSTLCVLDAMPHLEQKLFQQLLPVAQDKAPIIPSNKKVTQQSSQQHMPLPLRDLANGLAVASDPDGHHLLFVNYLHSAFLEKSITFNAKQKVDWQALGGKYILARQVQRRGHNGYTIAQAYSLDKPALIDAWPVETSHGKQFIAGYQLKKLAEQVVSNYLQSLNLKTIAPEKPAPGVVAKRIALRLWNELVKDPVLEKEPDEDVEEEDSWKYDGDDSRFHGVMACCLDTMQRELEPILAKGEFTPQLEADLKTRLSKVLDTMTEQPTAKLALFLHRKPKLDPLKLTVKTTDISDLLDIPDTPIYQTPGLEQAPCIMRAMAPAAA